MAAAAVLAVLAALLAGCAPWPSAPRLVKLGLVAPFEGYHRPLGYRVLPAVQGALEEQEVPGLAVALVALDDHLDPSQAADAARQLAVDRRVLAMVGPWTEESLEETLPVLEAEGLPALVPVPLLAPPQSPWVAALAPTGEELARFAARLLAGEGAASLHPVGGSLAQRVARASALPLSAEPGEAAYAFLDLSPEDAARWLSAEGGRWPRERIFAGYRLHSEKLLQLAGSQALGMRILAVEGWPDPDSAQARWAAQRFLAALEEGARDRLAVARVLVQGGSSAAGLTVYRVVALEYPAGLVAR